MLSQRGEYRFSDHFLFSFFFHQEFPRRDSMGEVCVQMRQAFRLGFEAAPCFEAERELFLFLRRGFQIVRHQPSAAVQWGWPRSKGGDRGLIAPPGQNYERPRVPWLGGRFPFGRRAFPNACRDPDSIPRAYLIPLWDATVRYIEARSGRLAMVPVPSHRYRLAWDAGS